MGLTDPFTRGDTVRELQNRLVGAGYDVGSVDGVFGSGTEAAVMWLQYDNELESTGLVDPATANLLGYDVPGAAPPATPPAQEVPPATPGADPEAAAPADPESEATPSAAEPEPEAPADPEPASDVGADDAAPEPQN